jgi:hypothetical protein
MNLDVFLAFSDIDVRFIQVVARTGLRDGLMLHRSG